MINPKEALEEILNKAKKPMRLSLPLNDCLGLVLAKDLKSKINVPVFDNSAMDGFALHANDINGDEPLQIAGETRAGQGAQAKIIPGTAISIMTGAPVPKGIGTVIPIENTEISRQTSDVRHQKKEKAQFVKIIKPVPLDANIRRAGEDIKKGTTVIEAGTVLNPIHIAVAASVGVDQLDVFARPKVAIVVTGDEIIKPGTPLKEGQIYESNSYLLNNLAKKLDIEVVLSAKAKDTLSHTVSTLKKALEKADVVLTTGGISVGKYDFVSAALKEIGAKCHFGTVAQKPGKPLSFFTLNNKLILSLPGNPVAVGLCYELYARPLLLKIAGNRNIKRGELQAQMNHTLKKKKGRVNFIRVLLDRKGDQALATSTGAQGSGILTSMIADGIAIIPASIDKIEKGQVVRVVDLGRDYR